MLSWFAFLGTENPLIFVVRANPKPIQSAFVFARKRASRALRGRSSNRLSGRSGGTDDAHFEAKGGKLFWLALLSLAKAPGSPSRN
jgi:hypothetical protein